MAYWPDDPSRGITPRYKKWFSKGKRARSSGKYSSVSAAWDSAKGRSYDIGVNARQYTSFEAGWYASSANPRQPHKRVRKALAKYVKGNVGLPKQWTPAQVRVNDKGQVQVKVNPRSIRGEVRTPRGVMIAGGKKHAARKRAHKNSGKTKTYKVHVPATSKDSGYDLTITAKSSSNAIKQARAYCAKRAGVPTSQYHLPKATKARAA